MPYELKGRNVLITGGSAGLGALLSTTFAAQGCNVAINYCNRLEVAEETQKACEKYGIKAVVVKADMCSVAQCKVAVDETIAKLGGLDIILANAGWTKITDFADLDAMDESEWDKCWAANVKAPHALLKAAKPTFDKNPDGGVMITTGSVSAVAHGGSSMAYAISKAAQLKLVKCLATTQGPKIRVNTVLPGLLLTEWGRRFPQAAIDQIEGRSVLKRSTGLDDCADAVLMLAKNTSMTGAQIQIDAGLSV